MRLRQIEVFHAIYSTGTVTAAAASLNVSQPSVSKVLAHSEMQLGFRLFDRVKGKLVPTPEADRLFKHATSVYDSVDELKMVAENLRTAEEGGIRIATTPAFGIDLLPKSIASYRKQHAGIVFRVETLHFEEILRALLESRVDLGLAFDSVSHSGIISEDLGAGRFVALTPADMKFENKQSLRVADLARQPFIKLDSKGPLGRILSNHIHSSSAQLNVVAHAETYQVAKALVSHGAGVTITDEITARSSGHDNVRVWPLEPALHFRVSMLRIAAAPVSLVCQNFMDHMREDIEAFLKRNRSYRRVADG